MPRSQKSKLRAREKRRQARAETQGLEVAQATGEAAGKPPSSVSGDRPENLPAAGTPSTPEAPDRATGAIAAGSGTTSAENIKSPKAESTSSTKGTESSLSEILDNKVVLLVQFLLQKYQKKEPIRKAEMLKFVIKQYRNHFSEILQRAAEHMELAFGVDLKEVDPIRHCYTLVNKLDLSYDSPLNEDEHMPKTGILMIALGVIFMKGNCAPEEAIWEVLNMMGVYADKKHFIYGDPKKVLTEDMVQLKYLEYRQVANSEPPCYEFLWGPRAHAETSKMKVLEFLARVHDSVPTAFPSRYEEALRDEEERARARAAARARTAALASARSRAIASSSSKAK